MVAQINPAVYPTKYKISCADRDGSNVVEFSDDIAKLLIDGKLTFDTYMDGSNSYCGFDPSKYNYWVGGALFSVAEGDPNEPRSGNWYNYTTSANKINFRWCLKVTNTSTAPQGNMIQRWTPQKPPLETIGTVYNDNQTARYDSLMTGREVICYYGQHYSTFYRMFPITNINIDRIQLDPTFQVIKVVPTYTDNIITRYTTSTTSYKWQDIKPEDKTPAGANYNADLWSKGWYDEFDETTGNISARYILVNCSVNARYGSYKFNKLTTAEYNGIFGESLTFPRWDADGDRVLPSGISSPIGYLVPMAEVPFSVKDEEGVLFQTLSGIDFPGSGAAVRGTNNPSSTVQYGYSDSAYGQYHYASVQAEGNTITHSTSNRGGGFLLNWSLGDLDGSFTLVTNGIGTEIVRKVEASTIGVTQYYFNSDGTISRNTVNSSSSATVALDLTPFSLESLWATLASMGVWVITDINSIPDDFELGVDFPTNVYRGEVLPDGTTTGRMFQGEDAEQQPWDTIDYEPVIPTPTPPGPGEENTGTDIRRPTGLGVGGTNGFITQYALTASQMAEIGRLLWLNFTDADYYKNFLFALTTTGSIDISNLMDYFVSLRVYPFPLINVPSWAAAGQDMYIGAGVIPLHFSSTIHTINNYADYIDAGSCEVPRYFNDFRDFTHTQILLFLPYCGTVQLNPADVIGGTLYAQYAIDFASGGVNAYVDLATHDGRYFMIASLSGNIGADIPLTATNAAQIASKIAGDALNFAGTIGGAAAGDLGNRIGGAVSALTGNAIGVAGAAAGLVTQPIQGAASIAQEGMRIATSDGVKIPMLSGGRGFGSFGQPQTAYIQIRRGMYVEGQTAPQGFKHAFGEAYDQPVQVGSCSGYTVFDNIDTSGLSCTDAERAAIVKQMQQGIFI